MIGPQGGEGREQGGKERGRWRFRTGHTAVRDVAASGEVQRGQLRHPPHAAQRDVGQAGAAREAQAAQARKQRQLRQPAAPLPVHSQPAEPPRSPGTAAWPWQPRALLVRGAQQDREKYHMQLQVPSEHHRTPNSG